jgi:hypothetical protein
MAKKAVDEVNHPRLEPKIKLIVHEFQNELETSIFPNYKSSSIHSLAKSDQNTVSGTNDSSTLNIKNTPELSLAYNRIVNAPTTTRSLKFQQHSS